jgi:short-subunit dehydrogenase
MIVILSRRAGSKSQDSRSTDGRAENVLITGASSGIGKVTAIYLAERGYHVIGTSRSMERLVDLEQTATRRGLSITPVQLNINTNGGVDQVMPHLMEQVGVIDVLVNNAGYSIWGPVESLSVTDIKTLFETNYFAAVRMSKAVLPGMIEQGRGKIINISSVLGRLGTPFMGAYVSSKFALEGLSESMRAELLPLGVRVSLVEPGIFKTNFTKNQIVADGVESVREGRYGELIGNYEERHKHFERFTSDPVEVAKVIHKIVRSRNPAFRYAVGIEAKLGIMGKRLVPERLFHAILNHATLG